MQMKIYDNFLIVGDFNSEMTESAMENFCGTYHLHNLIKDQTIVYKFTPNKLPQVIFKITNFRNWFIRFL